MPDAPKAVFVHGLGGSSLNWTDLMALMQGDVDGYAIDLGGFGQSPPPRDGDFSPQGHARSVIEFIDELQISIADIHEEINNTWFRPVELRKKA